MDYKSERNFDLLRFWDIIKSNSWRLLILNAVFIMSGVLYSLSLPDVYKAESILIPNMDNQANGLSNLAGQFGGLASLAGINIGGAESKEIDYALEVLKSRSFLYDFIQSNELSIIIMATNGWLREKNEYTYDEEIYNVDKGKWVRDVKPPFSIEPSTNEVYEKFLKELLTVHYDKKTGVIKVAIEHYSPFFAKKIVNEIVKALNQKIKQQKMSESILSIQYLENELSKTTLSNMQSLFYQLIEQEYKKLMLINVQDEYVLKIIDEAVVPEEKFKPKRALVVVMFFLLGVISSIIFMFFKTLKDVNRRDSKNER